MAAGTWFPFSEAEEVPRFFVRKVGCAGAVRTETSYKITTDFDGEEVPPSGRRGTSRSFFRPPVAFVVIPGSAGTLLRLPSDAGKAKSGAGLTNSAR